MKWEEMKKLRDTRIVSAACGDGFTVAVSEDGRLYSWGVAEYGQLGHHEQVLTVEPKMISGYDNVKFVSVACGTHHVLAISDSGSMWSWGNGEAGQLGHGNTHSLPRPKQIVTLSNVKLIKAAASNEMSYGLTSEGNLYSWGQGQGGELGHGDMKTYTIPKMISTFGNVKIVAIAAGFSHSVAVSDSGRLYSWGWGSHYKLGHGDTKSRATPTLVEGFDHIRFVSVACGNAHSCALTDKGRVYSWGWNKQGQLGFNHTEDVPKPKEIPLFNTVIKIACGTNHSVFLAKK